MTYRERREAKAERLRGWADQRVSRANATLKADERFTSDYAFNTQPGHIPERARIIAREDRAFQSLSKAAEMSARADGIERQAANAIYSDDPDAIERLREKLEKLEAERQRWADYNVSARKAAKTGGNGDLSILDDDQQRGLADVFRFQPYYIKPGRPAPSYCSSNLSGNISRLRERIERLSAPDANEPRISCPECGGRGTESAIAAHRAQVHA